MPSPDFDQSLHTMRNIIVRLACFAVSPTVPSDMIEFSSVRCFPQTAMPSLSICTSKTKGAVKKGKFANIQKSEMLIYQGF
jgi:hypothetical protein